MAWNRPNEDKAKVKVKGEQRNVHLKGLVAGAVVIVGAMIAIWLLVKHPAPEKPTKTSKHSPVAIKEVAPAPAVTNAASQRKYSDLTDKEKLAFLREKFGDNPPPNIKPIIYYLEHPSTRSFKMKPSKYAIFSHPSERTIAAFLSVRPGSFVMRPLTFDARFDKDFAESMFDKIEITADDTPEQRDLKQAVIDSKKEIAQLVKQGQKPSQIMSEVSKQLYDLGQYRLNLRKEVVKANQNPDMSDQDVADIVEAANKMLSDKGLQPLKMPSMLVRQLNLSRRQQKQVNSSDKGK